MTRINLIPPSELTDQHLFAEYRGRIAVRPGWYKKHGKPL